MNKKIMRLFSICTILLSLFSSRTLANPSNDFEQYIKLQLEFMAALQPDGGTIKIIYDPEWSEFGGALNRIVSEYQAGNTNDFGGVNGRVSEFNPKNYKFELISMPRINGREYDFDVTLSMRDISTVAFGDYFVPMYIFRPWPRELLMERAPRLAQFLVSVEGQELARRIFMLMIKPFPASDPYSRLERGEIVFSQSDLDQFNKNVAPIRKRVCELLLQLNSAKNKK